MNKKQFYIRERKYHFGNNETLSYEKFKLGRKIIGTDLFPKLLLGKKELKSYCEDYEWDVDESSNYNFKCQGREDTNILKKLIQLILNNDKEFSCISDKLLTSKIEIFMDRIKERDLYPDALIKSFLQKMLSEMQSVSIRTLILEMHKKTQSCTNEDKYNFFTQKCLSDNAYTEYLLSEYPVLERCLWSVFQEM